MLWMENRRTIINSRRSWKKDNNLTADFTPRRKMKPHRIPAYRVQLTINVLEFLDLRIHRQFFIVQDHISRPGHSCTSLRLNVRPKSSNTIEHDDEITLLHVDPFFHDVGSDEHVGWTFPETVSTHIQQSVPSSIKKMEHTSPGFLSASSFRTVPLSYCVKDCYHSPL